MSFALQVVVFALGLFAGIVLFVEIGRRVGLAHLAREGRGLTRGADAAEGAVFGLLALLIAFTFFGAAQRFDDRRELVADEANAIGTAYQRLDLLPADAKPELQALFRRYLEVRLVTYRNAEDRAATQARLDQGYALQDQIWEKAVRASQRPGVPASAAMLVIPSLNEMFDITDSRVAATRHHPPRVVYWLLASLCLIAGLLVGYSTAVNADRSWLHRFVFAAILSLTVYVTIEIEYPRLGLIRVDSADQALIDLRQHLR
ncbi:hypothetical protein MNR01_12410 [Lysobacter sp. S4-A87]|uniref:bestrophin-like domain n=1 Tax=Lysobacter sp. S4-A87 TaxID=2925843 RepID=UPI001F535058|nr:hypothetical protein [Lysobacter sp. S4-A87]UNK48548.1 hypothetical protein MNR01_12410 [Lysobacter sp. S4-A87]